MGCFDELAGLAEAKRTKSGDDWLVSTGGNAFAKVRKELAKLELEAERALNSNASPAKVRSILKRINVANAKMTELLWAYANKTESFDELAGLSEGSPSGGQDAADESALAEAAYAFPKDQGDAALLKLAKLCATTIKAARKLVKKGYPGTARTELIKLGNRIQTVKLEDEGPALTPDSESTVLEAVNWTPGAVAKLVAKLIKRGAKVNGGVITFNAGGYVWRMAPQKIGAAFDEDEGSALTPDSESTILEMKATQYQGAMATHWSKAKNVARGALKGIAWSGDRATKFRTLIKDANTSMIQAGNLLAQLSVMGESGSRFDELSGLVVEDSADADHTDADFEEAAGGKWTPSKKVRAIQQHAVAGAAAVRDIRNEVAKPTAYEKKLFKKAGDAFATIQSLAGSMQGQLEDVEDSADSADIEEAASMMRKVHAGVDNGVRLNLVERIRENLQQTTKDKRWRGKAGFALVRAATATNKALLGTYITRVVGDLDYVAEAGDALATVQLEDVEDSTPSGNFTEAKGTMTEAAVWKAVEKVAKKAGIKLNIRKIKDAFDGKYSWGFFQEKVGETQNPWGEKFYRIKGVGDVVGKTANYHKWDWKWTFKPLPLGEDIEAGSLDNTGNVVIEDDEYPTALDRVSAALGLEDGEAHGDDEIDEEEQEEASASDADAEETEEETSGERLSQAEDGEADEQRRAIE